ncbi:hypothetical protein EAE99_011300 [Botrytis elliptica]|nr:hypothetical protein EAE99_011300 [Botrytis elliptica]
MAGYIKNHGADNDQWIKADKLAKKVDYASPHRDGNGNNDSRVRDWSAATRGKVLEQWTRKNAENILHPRRYAVNESQVEQIRTWIKAMKSRLSQIPQSKSDDPVQFSVTYIGWSRKEFRRKQEHEQHTGLQQPVKCLLEATAYVMFPEDNFFMHHVTLLNIFTPEDAPYGEHLCSLLSLSYIMWGGLNGVIGGDDGILSKLSKLKMNDPWLQALDAVLSQNIYVQNAENFKLDGKIDRCFLAHEKTKSEATRVNELRKSVETAKLDLDEIYKSAEEVILDWTSLKENELGLATENLNLCIKLDATQRVAGRWAAFKAMVERLRSEDTDMEVDHNT